MKGARQSVDLSRVQQLQVGDQTVTQTNNIDTAEAETEENVMILEDIVWDDAKKVEIESWRTHDVYREIQDEGQKCMSTR